MILHVITSTPNILKYLFQEKLLLKSFKEKKLKTYVWNIKSKKKKKIQK